MHSRNILTLRFTYKITPNKTQSHTSHLGLLYQTNPLNNNMTIDKLPTNDDKSEMYQQHETIKIAVILKIIRTNSLYMSPTERNQAV